MLEKEAINKNIYFFVVFYLQKIKFICKFGSFSEFYCSFYCLKFNLFTIII